MQTHPLRAWRTSNKVTLAVLADRIGVKVTVSHLSEIERWENTPSLFLASKLSEATADDAGVPVVPISDFLQKCEPAEAAE